MEKNCIGIIGAGKGGLAFMKILLKIPDVYIKYVCDVDKNSPGLMYAKQYNIKCIDDYSEILNDKEVTLIFEATGQNFIFEDISRKKLPSTSLVGSQGTKVIYSLIDNYDEMNKSLSSYKLHLEKRIIERTEELEKANIELEKEEEITKNLYLREQKISEEKTKYLLHATHQLKAPFAAIQSYADVILAGYAGEINPKVKEIVGKINLRSKMLTNVINEMLELAKLRTTADSDNKSENDILEIAKTVIEAFKVVADSKNIKLNLISSQEKVILHCNKNQINVFFSTFIENGINYSHENTEIDILIFNKGDGKTHVEITDQGIGIPQKNLDNIFNEYFRSNNAVSFMPNGTGLGLAIAAEICRLHNAQISVKSKENVGTTFKVVF